jgi:hypothetical protein
MPRFSRRLQILLEEGQAAALERESHRTGRSVAALIRHAVDRTYRIDAGSRAEAMAAFLDADPVEVEDWAVEKRRIRDELAGIDGAAHRVP